ncbi:MAG: hypothetical protein HY053_02725 [Proteobacteria bacterium]|nr:hypothetical protein [Pseudomonadota bacterium]
MPFLAILPRGWHAAWAGAERFTRFYERPSWDIDEIEIDKKQKVKVSSKTHISNKFYKSVGFHAEIPGREEVPFTIQVVPPISGHHPQLVRPMPRGLVARSDVRVLAWEDPRQIPADGTDFDLSSQVDAVLDDLEHTYQTTGRPAASTIAVCQPVGAVATAVALLEMAKSPAKPSTMVLIAGPWDTRVNATPNNKLVKAVPFDRIERHLKHPIPHGYNILGEGQEVLPGFINAGAFAQDSAAKHLIAAPLGHMTDIIFGNTGAATKHENFYDNYWAFMDIFWAHAKQTIISVFREHEMPRGEFVYRGRRPEFYGMKVDYSAINDVATLIVEAKKDPICPPGQTKAFFRSCPDLPRHMKKYVLMKNVGHYGTFAGSEAEELRQNVILPFIEKHHGERMAQFTPDGAAAHRTAAALSPRQAARAARRKDRVLH